MANQFVPSPSERKSGSLGTVQVKNLRPGKYIYEYIDVESKFTERRDGSGSFQSLHWVFRPIGGEHQRPKTLPQDWMLRIMTTPDITPANRTGKIVAALLGHDELPEELEVDIAAFNGKYIVIDTAINGSFNRPKDDNSFSILTRERFYEWKWGQLELDDVFEASEASEVEK